MSALTQARHLITDTIRVLEAGARGWAVWDDCAEYSELYPTLAQAMNAARQLAAEQQEDRDADVEHEIERQPSLYDQADRATGAERKRLLKLAFLANGDFQ